MNMENNVENLLNILKENLHTMCDDLMETMTIVEDVLPSLMSSSPENDK